MSKYAPDTPPDWLVEDPPCDVCGSDPATCNCYPDACPDGERLMPKIHGKSLVARLRQHAQTDYDNDPEPSYSPREHVAWQAADEIERLNEQRERHVTENERRALVRTVIAEAGHQIGWFDPGSKRFAYNDEKEYLPERHAPYRVPVYAIPLPEGGKEL